MQWLVDEGVRHEPAADKWEAATDETSGGEGGQPIELLP